MTGIMTVDRPGLRHDARDGLERQRILVVDDDLGLRRFLTEALEAHGFSVDTLPSGLQLTDVLDSNPPDLVVLDVAMPGKNGFELCREIKASKCWRDIPILFLTGCCADVDFTIGIEMGGDAYMTKPFKMKELTKKISTLLS